MFSVVDKRLVIDFTSLLGLIDHLSNSPTIPESEQLALTTFGSTLAVQAIAHFKGPEAAMDILTTSIMEAQMEIEAVGLDTP